MKFSLKDLFWSVTMACLGTASATFAFHMRGEPSNTLLVILRLVFLGAPGPLFGVAVGKLFNRIEFGFFLGLILEVVFFISLEVWWTFA
jgi:hypothetical protein